jgi:hypothetical protein
VHQHAPRNNELEDAAAHVPPLRTTNMSHNMLR